MPTRQNCALLESVIDSASTLVETKKLVDKLDQDILVLKNKLGLREGEGVAEGSASAIVSGDAMDIDDMNEALEGKEADIEGGRAQSVVSARSIGVNRNRKHVSQFNHLLAHQLLCCQLIGLNSRLGGLCRYPLSIHRYQLPPGREQNGRKGTELILVVLHLSLVPNTLLIRAHVLLVL